MDTLKSSLPTTGTFDELAADLRRLKHEAVGTPSFTEIAARITSAREAQGLTPEQARMPRSSVYDVFRPGRKRINSGLVAEIVLALGGTEAEADAWKQRAIQIADRSPEPSTAAATQHQQNLTTLFSVVLCVAAVGVNHALNFSSTVLGLPLYLDMVGTAFASFAFGPLAGAAVGVATNLVGSMMNGDFSGWWFMLVQIAGAVLWGYGFRRWFGRGRLQFFSLNVLVAVLSSLIAVPIILFVFSGVEQLHGTAPIASTLQQLGTSLVGAVFSANMLASLADKLISGYLSLGALCLLSKYGFPFSETVKERVRKLTLKATLSKPKI